MIYLLIYLVIFGRLYYIKITGKGYCLALSILQYLLILLSRVLC